MEAGSAKQCVDMKAMCVTAGLINISSSVAILSFPLVGLSHLQLPLRRKLGVYAVFAVGFSYVISLILPYANAQTLTNIHSL